MYYIDKVLNSYIPAVSNDVINLVNCFYFYLHTCVTLCVIIHRFDLKIKIYIYILFHKKDG